MSDTWYYAVGVDQIGPLTLQEIKDTLPTLPNAKDVLVWRDGFSDWTRASDVPELRARTMAPPPLPRPTRASVQPVDTVGGPRPIEPNGIAGWLVLPVLGTILAPLYMVYGVFQLAAGLPAGSSLIGALGSLNANIKLYVFFELGFNIVMFVGWVIAIVYAFRHKKLYPGLFVGLTTLMLIGSLADVYVGTEVFKMSFTTEDAKNIVRPLFTLIIWGPYMLWSKRVRNTFIK